MGYDVLYDETMHNPTMVFYNIDPAHIEGKFKRVGSFRTDPLTSDPYVLDAYSHSGYDRGHVAPAGIFRDNRELNKQSFYQTNMTPQLANFNRGIWKRLETYNRKYVLTNKTVLHVIAGPVYDNQTLYLDDGENNKVAIPYGFFKVILDNNNRLFGAFLFENKKQKTSLLPTLVTSIDQIEKLTGIDLYKNLTIIESTISPYPFAK